MKDWLYRINPWGNIVVRNTDADEAGDYRIARRIDFWLGRWRGYVLTNIKPEDLD